MSDKAGFASYEEQDCRHIGFFLCWLCGASNPFGLTDDQLLTWGVDRLTGRPFKPGAAK